MNALTRWGPAGLLLAVALSQLYMTATGPLTPSKGGGFGMFATTDIRATRTWSADCLTLDGEPCRIRLPDRGTAGLGGYSRRFRTNPDPRTKSAAADLLARTRYVVLALDEVPAAWRDRKAFRPAESGEQGVEMLAIRLRAWRLRFRRDPAGFTAEPFGAPEERGRW